MSQKLIVPGILLCSFLSLAAQDHKSINLNGIWQFEQTKFAHPPESFTRTIKVPGLIHLAEPRIEDYEIFFQKPEKPVLKEQHNLLELDYLPKYSWYRKVVTIPAGMQESEFVLSIKKSQYNTQVYINGMDAGNSMECFTPIQLPVTSFLKPGEVNEILIRTGERIWLPAQAAGGTDKEKEHYLPGIWDDVSLEISGKLRVYKLLMLPDTIEGKVKAKILIQSLYPAQMLYGSAYYDSCRIQLDIYRKDDHTLATSTFLSGICKRDNLSYFEAEVTVPDPVLWSTENPFLYEVKVSIFENKILSDTYTDHFGIRNFKIRGKHFYLNGEKIYLRGTNITLHRFFEDPDCGDLAWNREWVCRLLCEIPHELDWNAMRICVGLVPDFWYDIADSAGLLLQNEWLYWQHHGWDEQIEKEYTNWVWSDGNHPSIVIWDAINENKNAFIGNELIPKLKQLDPTRVWDAGYMVEGDMQADEMDEPHTYMCGWELMNTSNVDQYIREHPYPLGQLTYWPPSYKDLLVKNTAQLVNEYGWIWLWRNGMPSKLTRNSFDYFTGVDASPSERREFQAYWLQCETEWLRAERSFAGVLAFCMLTNNYGYTGDYFTDDIKDLSPSPALKWFRHCFAPSAVFIDLADQRYFKHSGPFTPGSETVLTLTGINDFPHASQGRIKLKLLDNKGNKVLEKELTISMDPFGKTNLALKIRLPEEKGGYLILSEFYPEGIQEPILSRRYLRVGELIDYEWFDYINP